MTQNQGACAQSHPLENGMKVKADRDFGAIEVAMVVQGKTIGFFVTSEEAQKLSDALQEAITEMNSECGSCSCEGVKPTEAQDEADSEETKA